MKYLSIFQIDSEGEYYRPNPYFSDEEDLDGFVVDDDNADEEYHNKNYSNIIASLFSKRGGRRYYGGNQYDASEDESDDKMEAGIDDIEREERRR